MKILKQDSAIIEKLYNRYLNAHKRPIVDKVAKIIEDIRVGGDDALTRYTKKFDKAKLTPKQLKVTESEISAAYENITSDFISNLKQIMNNVYLFYKKQNHKPCRVRDDDGVKIKEQILPLETVGIYIPAGTAPLVSTVYMTVIPAKVAGVKNIVIITPPDKNGNINPYILAVANLLEVKNIYKAGGAQAIAALAFGTKTIPKVDKIIGPGNMYVTEAKRQLFGFVDIDMLAGPSELAIIATRNSNVNFIAADLESQIEHLGGLAVLVTTSREILKQVKNKVKKGYGIFAKNIEEAVEIVNKIAPEHLQILSKNPENIAKKIRNAGAIFLGPYSPTPLGDYAAGPSHVLPTLGSAKFFSGLSASDFMKTSHVISYSKRALEKIRGPIEKIATLEGLLKHRDSVNIRFN